MDAITHLGTPLENDLKDPLLDVYHCDGASALDEVETRWWLASDKRTNLVDFSV